MCFNIICSCETDCFPVSGTLKTFIVIVVALYKQAGLKFTILLSRPPECWDYRSSVGNNKVFKVCVCVSLCVCVCLCLGGGRGQKGALESLELELQAAVSTQLQCWALNLSPLLEQQVL